MSPVIGTFYCLEFKRMQRGESTAPQWISQMELGHEELLPKPKAMDQLRAECLSRHVALESHTDSC